MDVVAFSVELIEVDVIVRAYGCEDGFKPIKMRCRQHPAAPLGREDKMHVHQEYDMPTSPDVHGLT
jgi:hypothetical protein